MQKFILATSDFAKGIQTDMNHYVTRDKINDAIFRQKLDSISKSILRRQNPVKLVFVGISTFDAKNPIIGSLLHELDVKEMVLSSDLFKGAPSTPGQNSEIQNAWIGYTMEQNLNLEEILTITIITIIAVIYHHLHLHRRCLLHLVLGPIYHHHYLLFLHHLEDF